MVDPGRQTIVGQDHSLAAHFGDRTIAPIEMLAAFKFPHFFRRDLVDFVVGKVGQIERLWIRTRTPPDAIAPRANSSWPGKPSFRTMKILSGAFNSRAISCATGTPPRGNASTSVSSWFAYW